MACNTVHSHHFRSQYTLKVEQYSTVQTLVQRCYC